MRRICHIFLLLLASCLGAAAQPATTSCPEITVTGPSGVTKAGDLMTFTASISNGLRGKIEYDWSVSEGAIVSGQWTPAINVGTTPEMVGTNVTATVKIRGLAADCADTASEIAGVAVEPMCQCAADEFGVISKNDVKARIDNFYIRLQNDPGMEGFIIVRLDKKENRGYQKMFLKSMYDAIVRLKKDPSRVTFLISVGKHETDATLYLIPVDTDFPTTDEALTLIKGEEFKQKIKTLFPKTN